MFVTRDNDSFSALGVIMMNKTHSGEERGTNGFFDLYLDHIYFNVFTFIGIGRDLSLQYLNRRNESTKRVHSLLLYTEDLS